MNFFKRSNKDNKPDLELIKLYQETDDLNYLGELYERYTTLVYGICLKYLKDREDSKDAVMQIFEKLIVEVKARKIENFKSWLHVVSKNYCLMALRVGKLKGTDVGFNDQLENETISLQDNNLANFDDNINEKMLESLDKAMFNLPDEQKQCIDLFFIQNKSYKEICDVTGFELNKVKSYIQNGKRNLKIFIQNSMIVNLVLLSMTIYF